MKSKTFVLETTANVKALFCHCYSIAYSNGTYVIATSGPIVSSTNGLIYTIESNTPSLSSVIAYSNSFAGVGSSGLIYQSSNGVSWTQRNSGTANNLNGVAAGNGLLVAVGNNGAVQTSPTGTIWTSRLSGTSLPLYGVAYSNGVYVAVGQEGTVVTSPDSVNWTTRNIGATGKPTLYGSAFINGRFDVTGTGGTVMESDPVAPLFDLQIHGNPPQNAFTFFATPGTTFRLVSSPNLVGGAWSTVATFNNAAAITQWTNSAVGGDSTYFRLASP